MLRHSQAIEGLLIELAFVEQEVFLGRNLVEARHDAAASSVEAFVFVADVANDLARQSRYVDRSFRREVHGDEEDGFRHCRLRHDAGKRILLQISIDDGIADLVAEFVWVTFSDRL
jgi:hypothetical protein